MRNISIALLLSLFFFSCKKEKSDTVIGTVKENIGCSANSWLVAIENPDPDKHFFICNETAVFATTYNCSNAVFINNLPNHLAVAGKKIRFSVKSVEQYSCLSYTFAPNHIEARDISEVR